MKLRQDVMQQTVHEYVRNFPAIANKRTAIGKVEKLAVEAAAGSLLSSAIQSQPARGLPAREAESRKLARVDVKKRLGALGKKMGLVVKVGVQGLQPRLDAMGNALYLPSEAALAAAVFAGTAGKGALGRETFEAAVRLGSIPKKARAEEIARALFLLHLCEKGLDGALEDLFLGSRALEWLAESGRAGEAGKVRHALYAAQLKFAKALL